MRAFSLLILLVTLAAAIAAEQNKKQYTTRYDNIDIDRILTNERLIQGYIKCMMDEGPCTPEGKELKRTLPDALATGCTKCTGKQQQTSEKVIRFLTSKRPRDWDRLMKKYDPEGQHNKRYEAELERIKSVKE